MNQRELFSDELLGAYLDGELSPEERLDVEQLLDKHPQRRQALEELQAISAGLQSLPQHRLGDDFYVRVLEAADAEPEVTVATKEAATVEPRSRETGLRPLVYAAVVIAVAVLFMVFGPRLLPTGQGVTPPVPPLAGVDVDPVPPHPEVDPIAQEDAYVADIGKLVLIVDVKLTDQGVDEDYLHRVLTGQNVIYDEDLEVDDELEASLLETRFINKPKEGAPPAELFYVVAKGYQIDAAWNHLQSAEARKSVIRASLDVAALPKELDAFQQLRLADRQNLAAREMLARVNSSRARRVLVELGALAQLSLGSNLSVSALIGDSQTKPAPPAPRDDAPSLQPKAYGMDTTYEVLFVVSRGKGDKVEAK